MRVKFGASVARERFFMIDSCILKSVILPNFLSLQRGLLKAVKALGWYLEEKDLAQLSINLCDYSITSMHTAYEECCRIAKVSTATSREINCVNLSIQQLN